LDVPRRARASRHRRRRERRAVASGCGALPAVCVDPLPHSGAAADACGAPAACRGDADGRWAAGRVRVPGVFLPSAGDDNRGARERAGTMTIHVDVWLRGDNHATTESIDSVAREPRAWGDDDVRLVLEGMLRAMHRLKHAGSPGEADQPIAL